MSKDFDTNWLMGHYARHEHAKGRTLCEAFSSEAVESESDLHDDIIKACRDRGWIVIHSRMDAPTTTAVGVPDFLILADRGRLFMFEAKSKTGKLTSEQRGFAMMADMLGFTVHVVRSLFDFQNIVNQNPESKTP